MTRPGKLVTDLQHKPQDQLRVGYLSWRYPVLSFTFVVREVAALRARGVVVETMSIRPGLSQDIVLDPIRASETWTILPISTRKVVLAHARGLSRGIRPYFGVLLSALRDGLPTGLSGLRRELMYFGEAVLLAERLRKRGLNHLHVHFGDAAGEVGRLTALLEKRRVRTEPFTWSITIHGPGELQNPTRHLIPQKLRQADLVFAVSEPARATLISYVEDDPSSWSKMHVVHCGLDMNEWQAIGSHKDPSGPTKILTVGRLAPQKSHQILIEAAGILRDRGVDFALSIAGEGVERPRLEESIRSLRLEDRVTLLGAVNRESVPALIAGSDIFCLASVAEGLPVVLMEAMASCVPVVTTNLPGISDLIEDNVSGLLVPSASPDLLADALERLCGDPELGARLAKAGYASVAAGFDIKTSAEKLEAHWRRTRAAAESPALH